MSTPTLGPIDNNALAITRQFSGKSIEFDGYDGYAQAIPLSATVANLTSITVACWVNFTASVSSGQTIMHSGAQKAAPNDESWRIGRSQVGGGAPNNKMIVDIRDDSVPSKLKQYITTSTIADDAWHHIAFTFEEADGYIDGYDGTLLLYVDGVRDLPGDRDNDDPIASLHQPRCRS